MPNCLKIPFFRQFDSHLLIYLDPPFNSNRSYNVLFKDESGLEADSQIHAFIDTTHLSIALLKYRLKDSFGLEPVGQKRSEDTPVLMSAKHEESLTASGDEDRSVPAPTYRIIGEPEDLESAKQLASEDRYQFQ